MAKQTKLEKALADLQAQEQRLIAEIAELEGQQGALDLADVAASVKEQQRIAADLAANKQTAEIVKASIADVKAQLAQERAEANRAAGEKLQPIEKQRMEAVVETAAILKGQIEALYETQNALKRLSFIREAVCPWNLYNALCHAESVWVNGGSWLPDRRAYEKEWREKANQEERRNRKKSTRPSKLVKMTKYGAVEVGVLEELKDKIRG